ncbi:MAG: hypothetical protein AAGG09_08945 [Pseudomonadota bacterium]
MGALFDIAGYLAKPIVLGVLVLILLGLLNEGAAPRLGGGSFECQGFTNDPEWNRVICQYHPARLLNMPVNELLPAFGAAPETDTEAGS